uniref:Uncharacterized protein n=1 Tax=Candidatus Kentrum sp. FM TaxID=2126340 RepID=A0A450TH94_9GAMM|nr:MAG: hypothetical protein BECKFM1743C_GA0114222_104293 [Candidatus Kentron sp. FM]VFJ72425.1 MAG: hypothetical protein BECKFM1743A_GA0114220_106451 [Candidatus Kentron sp. FM]VFK17308.1 MAG: hypothetical protein BECKFM1743B_GA0114221_104723 [Candidatus Kentron sp. FM]
MLHFGNAPIGCGSPRWISNHDQSLRVEYGAPRVLWPIRMYARRAYSTLQGAANSLILVRYTSLPTKKYARSSRYRYSLSKKADLRRRSK